MVKLSLSDEVGGDDEGVVFNKGNKARGCFLPFFSIFTGGAEEDELCKFKFFF